MFYSQFILAKKGTLGTIWIAAHLERKLRKNQVADTDIGDSVDSILFPDVPIALRLSSHLLLGVVRIYSRKVNYLFDDCSEALLKVKQAFRPTTVDLPPEESTAPYHSITLPETFDLDDFELPDSDILQGNYVDHHVSTREQITLQDTMEGVVYSTSQFGLDERFGDGETYGFDLDEEMFLTKVAASRHAGDMLASDTEPHVPLQLTSPLELKENHEEINGNPKAMVVPDRLDGLAGSTDYIEYAQAPRTPGLVEESNLFKTQEASAYDDQLELVEQPNFSNIQEASTSDYNLDSEAHNITNFAAKENMTIITRHPDIELKSRVDSPPTAGNSVLAEPVKFTSPGFETSYRNCTAFDSVNNGLPDLQNGIDMNNEPGSCCVDRANADIVERVNLEGTSWPSFSNEVHAGKDFSRALFSGIENNCMKSLSSTCEPVSDYVLQTNQVAVAPEIPNNVVNAGNMENQWPTNNLVPSNVEFPGREDLEISEKNQACQDLKICELLSSNVDEKLTAAKSHVLQSCKNLNQLSMLNYGCDVSASSLLPSGVLGLCSAEISGGKEAPHAAEASTDFQGERCNAPDITEHHFNENKITEPASSAEIQTDNSKCNIVDIILRENRIKNMAGFENFELPARERLLCVPEGRADIQENFMDSTPYLLSGGGGDFGININSGKKRSFTESTLTMHSLNSDEYLVGARSKRTKEYIPEGDDLLASILAGRSPVLKIAPTPVPQPRITRMKHQESAPRSASKRKVLMDDDMILHGDVIRQQLTSTEDIRRTRKKAPCTRPEIWMIQKEFLEDEIFSEPVFTGYSGRLALLHSQTYDLRKIRISPTDTYNPLLEAATKQNAGLLKDETNALKAANNMTFSVGPNVNHLTEMEWTNKSLVGGNHVKASHSGNLQDEDRVSQFLSTETPLEMNAICDVRVAENVNFGIESASSPNFGMGYEKEISGHFTLRSALFDKEAAGNHFVRIGASGVQDVQSVAMESSIGRGKAVNAPVVENNVSTTVSGAAEARARDELLEQIEVGFGRSINMQTTREANPSLQISPETNFPSGQVVACFGTVEENADSAAVGGASDVRGRDELLEQNEVGFESSMDMQTTQEAHPSLEISPNTNFPSGEIVATFGTVEENENSSVVGGEAEARVREEFLKQTEVGFGSSMDMQTTREANPSLEISSETIFPSVQDIATFVTVEENDVSAAVGEAAEARVRDELLEQTEVGFGSSIDMQTTREANSSLEISPETNFPSVQVIATLGTVEENDDSAAVCGAAEARVREELEQTKNGFGSIIDMQTTQEENPSLEISPVTNFPSGQVVATSGTMEENDDPAAVCESAEARARDELLEQTEIGFGSSIDVMTTQEANPSLEISPGTNFPSVQVIATVGAVEENDDSSGVGAAEARVRDELEQTKVGFGSIIDVKTSLEANPSLEISPKTNFPSVQFVATFGTMEENDASSAIGAAEARVRDELLEQTAIGFGCSIDVQTTQEANPSLEISPVTNFLSGQVVATFGTVEENDDSSAVGGSAEARARDELLEKTNVGFGSSIDVKTTLEENPSLEISPVTNFPSVQVVATFGTIEKNDDSSAVGGSAEARVRDELLEQTEVGFGSIIDVKTTGEANPSLEISPETNFPSDQVVGTFGTAEEISNHEQGMLLNGQEVPAPQLVYDMAKNLTSYGSIEELKTASSYPVKLNTDVENMSSIDGQYSGHPPGFREADAHCTMEEAISVADRTATVDCMDAEYKADLHDTGFLNADDDDVAGAQEHRRSAEQNSFLENSGWSSRTRAVANYLKVLFEKEVEHERKVVSMDNLLTGKTRKEASRMFFEALVLKTRDYIHVQQETPFEDIKLKPRVMLMKY